MSKPFDFTVVGGGLLGLATAHTLATRWPGSRIAVLEKEERWASHQSGRNSGVIHSGIYYKPGSMKAKFCREGRERMLAFCQEHDVRHDMCGKVIVATERSQLERLKELERRGTENGLELKWVEGEDLLAIEPHVKGIAAIYVKDAGIVDFPGVADTLARLGRDAGVEILLGSQVERIDQDSNGLRVSGPDFEVETRFLINCAGLHSDRIGRMAGGDPPVHIVPFRGEYFELRPEKHHLVKGLIYPVPDPALPFLGVHLTRMIKGSVHAGPNAVLAFSREGYDRWTMNAKDLGEIVTFPGLWRLAGRFWKSAIHEVTRSFSKSLFAASCRKLVPEVQAADLTPSPAGVRAQALSDEGHLVHDFIIEEGPRAIHVYNAPSPAATSSIRIAEGIVDRIPTDFHPRPMPGAVLAGSS